MLIDVNSSEVSDALRRRVSSELPRKQRSELGQFMTPSRIAQFMASLFENSIGQHCRLLDAGAGVGALTLAFLDQWRLDQSPSKTLTATLFEIDDTVREHLTERLRAAMRAGEVAFEVYAEDFVGKAVEWVRSGDRRFTHAILNPPYKKISSSSKYRSDLRMARIETVNLYSAFVALSLELLENNGELVAIIPRSFCNGPYYKSFRQTLLSQSAITRIHLFNARDKAFGEDAVLQENVIIALKRGARQQAVEISTSTDDSLEDYASISVPFSHIVHPDDREQFIRIPTTVSRDAIDLAHTRLYPLGHLGIEVSTGPIVDFRMREHLRDNPEKNTVPLLYPGHFEMDAMVWPKADFRKPNAIALNDETWRWLYPKGFYTVVRRFSSKEERRRIVASVVDPECFPDYELLGFENHLNVFHQKKRGLRPELAFGLAAYLNSEIVDKHFRKFNGHTQVNATDLRCMRYLDISALIELGSQAMSRSPGLRSLHPLDLEALLA